jgi:hypothetical protein
MGRYMLCPMAWLALTSMVARIIWDFSERREKSSDGPTSSFSPFVHHFLVEGPAHPDELDRP